MLAGMQSGVKATLGPRTRRTSDITSIDIIPLVPRSSWTAFTIPWKRNRIMYLSLLIALGVLAFTRFLTAFYQARQEVWKLQKGNLVVSLDLDHGNIRKGPGADNV